MLQPEFCQCCGEIVYDNVIDYDLPPPTDKDGNWSTICKLGHNNYALRYFDYIDLP